MSATFCIAQSPQAIDDECEMKAIPVGLLLSSMSGIFFALSASHCASAQSYSGSAGLCENGVPLLCRVARSTAPASQAKRSLP